MKLHESKALKREERVPVEKNAGEGKRENQRQVRIAWSSSSSMTSIINCRDFGRVLRKNRFLCFFFWFRFLLIVSVGGVVVVFAVGWRLG